MKLLFFTINVMLCSQMLVGMIDGPNPKAVWRDLQRQAVRNAQFSNKKEQQDVKETKSEVKSNTKKELPKETVPESFSREALSLLCNKYANSSDALKQHYARIGSSLLSKLNDHPMMTARLEAVYQTLLAPHKIIKRGRAFPINLKNQLQRLGIHNPDHCVMNGTPFEQQLLDEVFMILNCLGRNVDDMHLSTTLRDLVAITAHSAIHMRKPDSIERGFTLVDFCQILLKLDEYCMQQENGMTMQSTKDGSEILSQVVSLSSKTLKRAIALTPDANKRLDFQLSPQAFNESTIDFILHKILLNQSSTCASAQSLHKAVVPLQEKLNENLCVTRKAASLDELMSSPDTMLLTIFLHAIA